MAREDGEPTGSPTGSPPPQKYKSLNEILSAVTVKQEPRPKTSRATAHGEAMKDKNRHKQARSTTAQARPMARKPGSSKAARHDSDDDSEPRSSRRPSSYKDEVVFGTCVFIPEGPKAFIGKANPPSVAFTLEATEYGFCVTAKAEGDLAIPRDSTYRDLKELLRDIIPAPFEVIDKAIDARLEAGATEKDMRSLGEFKLLNKEGRKLTLINIAAPTGEHAAAAVTKSTRWRERTLYIAAPFDVTEWCPDNVLTYLPCKRPNTREDALRAQRTNATSQEGHDGSEDEHRAWKGKSKRKRSESPVEFFDKSPPRAHRRPTKRSRRRSPDSPAKPSAGAARPSTSTNTISIHGSDSEPENNSVAVIQGGNAAGLDSSDALLTNEHFAELDNLLRSGFPAVDAAASVPPGAPATLPISNGDSAPVFAVASASSLPIPSPVPLLPGTVTSDPVPHTPIPQHTIVTGFGFGSPPKIRNWLDEF